MAYGGELVGTSAADRAARVARLAACPALPSVPDGWQVVELRPLPGTLRLPPGAVDYPDEVPTTAEQMWSDSVIGTLMLQLDDATDRSFGFSIDPGEPTPIPTPVDEGTCAAPFAGRMAAVRSLYWVRSARPTETTFVAVTDIPVAGDTQLGAGVTSGSRAGRDTLLSALATLRLRGR